MAKGILWTDYEKNYLIKNYGKISVVKIAKHLKKTEKQIYDYASLLRTKGEYLKYLKR